MAHACPECGQYCTCKGDWDDIDMGLWIGCICCMDLDDCDDEEYFDPFDDDDNYDDDPNDSRNL